MSNCSFLKPILNIHPSGVLTTHFDSYMAGTTWNCCHFGVFCGHHTTVHHVTSVHAKPQVGIEDYSLIRVQELCESRGGRPGLSVLMSLTVSVDVKQH